MKKFRKYTNWITAFIFAVAVIVVYKTFDNLKYITEYIALFFKAAGSFFAGFAIAYLLNMPAVRINKRLKNIKNSYIKEHSYGISVVCVYLLAAVIIYVLVCTIIPALFRNVLDFYLALPDYLQMAEDFVNNNEILTRFGLQDNFDISTTIYDLIKIFDISKINEYAQGVFGITSGLVNSFISIIISVYMLLDKEKIINIIKRTVKAIFNNKKGEKIIRRSRMINSIFINYIYSRVICSILMSVICSVVLSILGIKYAIVLGVFIGLSDMIPYFGSIVSSVSVTVITFFTGGFWKCIWCGITLFILQQIDGNVISPKVMGTSLDISPLLVIFAVVVGGNMFGFAGMLLAVPVVTVVKRVMSQILYEREQKNLVKSSGGTDFE